MDPTEIFSNSDALLDGLKKANKVTSRFHGDYTTLERAIFLSWWCSRGDCEFCYLSTQKKKIKDSSLARRTLESIMAEAEICRRVGWRVEFLAAGYGSLGIEEIRKIAQMVAYTTGKEVWLNLGALNKGELSSFGGEVKGVVASVETLDKRVQRDVCPAKPLDTSMRMLQEAEKLGLKKGATIILGLGEEISQIQALLDFIEKTRLDRLTVYSLNPHRGTPYSNFPSPASLYQAGVIALTRLNYPELEIIGGTWIDQLSNIGLMLLAGANGITKYPLFSMYGNRYGKKVEEEVRFANRRLLGTFTDMRVLRGEKKLSKARDPYYVFQESPLSIPADIEEEITLLRRGIDSKIDSYIKTVEKRLEKFTSP